jgi:hypothetical protein
MTELKKQGTSFNEEAYDTTEEQTQSGFNEIMNEETGLPSKFPLSGKNLIIAGIGVGVLALIIVAYFYIKPDFFGPKAVEDEIYFDEPWGDYEEELPPLFTYSAYEADRLRAVGYTAREIEEFEFQEIIDIQPLIETQIEARREVFLDMYRAFLREARESGNEQYNYVLSNTYLGLPPQEFIEEDERRDYVTYTENVDYWKMPLQGWQPTIKLRLANDAVIYMHVTPSRYEELRDSGNMNIRYDYIYYKGVKSVTNVTEIVH